MPEVDIESDIKQDPEIKFDDRDIILLKMMDSINWLHNKANNGRITNKDIKIINARISVFKALAYMCSVYNQVKKDVEIEEINERLKKIERLMAQEGGKKNEIEHWPD